MKMSRKLAALILALAMTVSCACVFAEDVPSCPAASSETVAELLKVPDFKFFVRHEGIGKGSSVVYTAPSEESLRLADGKASCRLDNEIAAAGYVDGWLLVRYDIKDNKARVGYLPPKVSRGVKADVGKLEFSDITVTLEERIDITDNPRSNSTPFGTLPEGTEITILGKYTYTGNWWYVETKLDGQLTRGFINRSDAAIVVDGVVYYGNEELGFPAASPENNQQTGMVAVTGTEDDAIIVRKHIGADSNMVARVYGGDLYPCYGSGEGRNNRIWYYIWVDGVWGWISSGHAVFMENE